MITDPLVAGGYPGITIDGYFGGSGLGRLGSPDFLPKFQHTDQFEFLDSLSWLRGNHPFKAGADIIAPMKNQYMDVPATRGTMRFRNALTGNPMGDLPARLCVGASSSRTSGSSSSAIGRDGVRPGRLEDQSALTINLGLRYDFITPALEANDAQTNFNPAGTGSLVFAGSGFARGPRTREAGYEQLRAARRRGYRLDHRTVIRGGWGVFYNLFDRVGSEDQLALNCARARQQLGDPDTRDRRCSS